MDIGRDAGGIYRNIAREVSRTNLESSITQSIGWFDILKAIAHRAHSEDTLKFHLADCAIIDNGKLSSYIYSDFNGCARSSKIDSKAMVKEKFYKISDIFKSNNEHTAVLHQSDKESVVLGRPEFEELLDRLPMSGIVQCFVPSRGAPDEYKTFKTSYWLDANAKCIMKTEKLIVSSNVMGTKHSKSTTNMSRALNKQMEDAVLLLVGLIQGHFNGRVFQLDVEYVHDNNGKVWMVQVCHCVTAKDGSERLSKSPEHWKATRTAESVDVVDTLDLGLTSKRISQIGRHSDERVFLRTRSIKPVDENLVNDTCYEIDVARARSRGATRLPRSPSRSPDRVGGEEFLSTMGTLNIPNARLGPEVPLGTNTAVLGSSQLAGCQGDFCHFDTSYLEHINEDILGQTNQLSEFRRKLMSQNTAVAEDASSTNAEIHNLIKLGSEMGSLTSSKYRDSKKENQDLLTIPLRVIIQARKEMPLVKLLLSRVRRGEEGDYFSQDSYADVAIGSHLPSRYYNDVPCCMNCFKVYDIIEKARTKAMAKIHKPDSALDPPFTNTFARTMLKDSKKSITAGNNSNSSLMSSMAADSRDEGLGVALRAIEGLTKQDIAEIRSMSKPPAAVEVVVEAVMSLLVGRLLTFGDARRLFSGGEAFLNMLRDFKLEDVSDAKLKLVEPYVDNPLFRPENLIGVSRCASKFCSWVLGVTQAARWQRGIGHKRTNMIIPESALEASGSLELKGSISTSSLSTLEKKVDNYNRHPTTTNSSNGNNISSSDLNFIQKLEKKKASKQEKRQQEDDFEDAPLLKDGGGGGGGKGGVGSTYVSSQLKKSGLLSRSYDSLKKVGGSAIETPTMPPTPSLSKREKNAMAAYQKKSADRLSSLNKSEGNLAFAGHYKIYRCQDGITQMPYLVQGNLSTQATRCNFVVVHDFFDTCDNTAILMKPLVQRHAGCQILCFNYPGQAHTVWPRPLAVERNHGAPETLMNNEWMADRLHELLQHVEAEGDMLLALPFHLVGIGLGSNLAAAFCRKWGSKPYYRNSLKSLVSINGFLYPDPQLTSILHTASQLFESTPLTRPDIPVSYWSRYLFSEDYLRRVNPNLALNIYTAVSNPITNEGRAKLSQGCLQSIDLRGALSPDYVPSVKMKSSSIGSTLLLNSGEESITIPLILLQSTENFLINASNIDPFLSGRSVKHLWSHQLNFLSASTLNQVADVTAQWVGRMSQSSEDYSQYSLLGKMGLSQLVETINNPRGAFVMWIRAGHQVSQENKAAVLDLLDALACPTIEYLGLATSESTFNSSTSVGGASSSTTTSLLGKKSEDMLAATNRSMNVLFSLNEDPSSSSSSSSSAAAAAALKAARLLEQDSSSQSGSSIVNESTPSTSPSSSSSSSTSVEDPSMLPSSATSPTRHSSTASSSSSSLHTSLLSPILEGKPSIMDEHMIDSATPLGESSSLSTETSTAEKKQPIRSLDVPFPNLNQALVLESPAMPPRIEKPVEMNKKSKKEPEPAIQIGERGVLYSQNEPSSLSMAQQSITPTTSSSTSLENVVNLDEVEDGTLASREQRHQKAWISNANERDESLPQNPHELEALLAEKAQQYLELKQKLEQQQQELQDRRWKQREEQQEERRQQFQSEDEKLLQQLELDIQQRKQQRKNEEKQRRVEYQVLNSSLVAKGLLDTDDNNLDTSSQKNEIPQQPVLELVPMDYDAPQELPKFVSEAQAGMDEQLDLLLRDEAMAKERGIDSMETFEQVKRQMAQRQIERDQKLRHLGDEDQFHLFDQSAIDIQRAVRGFVGRRRAKQKAHDMELQRVLESRLILAQALIRGFLGRRKVARLRRLHQFALVRGQAIVLIQSVIRAFIARRFVQRLRRHVKATDIQRCFRGRLGRLAANRERLRLTLLRRKHQAACKIQSSWRMKVAVEEFRSLRVHMLAALEIQRLFRGFLARKAVQRRRKWQQAAPGPDRIALGLEMIEETKAAFERQQEEIDALHRAQERAEARVSYIYSELRESEQELKVLERELQEIDQIERDLQTLSHERDCLVLGITDAAGLPRTGAVSGQEALLKGKASTFANDPDQERRRKAEAYAMEMTIQIKRAEREKKRHDLENEFAAVFAEVEKKKKALMRLEASLADMEATRERKDREFRRLQQNLMQLLLEQKKELDDLREKGIELETATATTAAAATATAMKAKEHEKRSTAMFAQTEELMKFQFMSMSLSYFSSLNMLKQLRDMNADTTSAAVTSSAEAAAAAAAAASAANLPALKKLNLGAQDFVEASVQKKKSELEVAEKAEKELKKLKEDKKTFPDNVRLWTVPDVCRWLETLFLGKYIPAFQEAAVDGPFLLELREEDLVQVLGVTHKLHVRKIMISREKLKPLGEQEKSLLEAVEREEKAEEKRKTVGVPDLDTVFSQARNGRLKRLEESLNLGFPVDSEDERGNTLLLLACQNSNRRMVEMLLLRGANVNHQNSQGNTALHFALSFDSEGTLGEYLIEHGADDTIENIDGLTPYDGLAQ